MRKLGTLGMLALSMAAMGAAMPQLHGNSYTTQQQDRTAPRQGYSTSPYEAMRGWRSSRRQRLAGPDGRFLNQRQRRKGERQSGRPSKWHNGRKKHSSPRKYKAK